MKKALSKKIFYSIVFSIEIFQISDGNDAKVQFRKSFDFARLSQTFPLADKMWPSDWLTN